MSSFLELLNTADVESLMKLKGINKPLADRILAARPFTSVEDCLKVEGLGEKLLAKLQNAYVEQVTQQTELEETVEKLVEKDETPQRKPTPRWLRVLRGVLITLILLGGIYAAIIYGVPYIYEKFLRPVENNAADLVRLNSEITTLQTRVSTLESRTDAVDQAIAAQNETLANLQTLQADLQQKMTNQNSQVNAELTYQINLMRSIEFLSRARLYLSQSNFGLAREDVLSARNLLSGLQSSAPASQAYAFNEALTRLDMALANLPAYPVVAVYDVDIAWQLLTEGLNAVAPTVIAPSAVPTEATLPPSLTPEVTGTPQP